MQIHQIPLDKPLTSCYTGNTMPNWCNNSVQFTHTDPKMIERVIQAYSRGELFSEFFPRPQEIENSGAACAWSVNNWGTKWDAPGDEKIDDPMPSHLGYVSTVTLSFDTAWSPPIEFYNRLIDQFGFEIEADWNESGMCFCGRLYKSGVTRDWSYSGDNLDGIPDDVIELWQLNEVYGV